LTGKSQQELPTKLKISLNAYSFNGPLMKGDMNPDELLEYCAANQFDAVDITAYYFPGYPEVPSDEYLYHIKQKAFLLGLEISGTGVRNNFTDPDPAKREASVELVKNWIGAAEKLEVPVIQVFSPQQLMLRISLAKKWSIIWSPASRNVLNLGKLMGLLLEYKTIMIFLKQPKRPLESFNVSTQNGLD
jgi:hypothetical protein